MICSVFTLRRTREAGDKVALKLRREGRGGEGRGGDDLFCVHSQENWRGGGQGCPEAEEGGEGRG